MQRTCRLDAQPLQLYDGFRWRSLLIPKIILTWSGHYSQCTIAYWMSVDSWMFNASSMQALLTVSRVPLQCHTKGNGLINSEKGLSQENKALPRCFLHVLLHKRHVRCAAYADGQISLCTLHTTSVLPLYLSKRWNTAV